MRTILAVAIMAIAVSIVGVGPLAVTDNIDARESGNLPAGSSGGESEGSGIYTTLWSGCSTYMPNVYWTIASHKVGSN